MKRLYLIRHAKSSWKYPVDDLNRPLKTRGLNDAQLVAVHTKKIFKLPDMVLCSPSKRTRQTAKIFQNKWLIDNSLIQLKEELYDFSGENLIKVISECDDCVNNLMIFAHNFAVTDFVNTFGTIDINSVPTCGFVVIDFEISSWKYLKKGQTVYKLFPKDLK
ncbi:MAG: SixA phosphatase family protein [Flavobacteriaceae bacterium]